MHAYPRSSIHLRRRNSLCWPIGPWLIAAALVLGVTESRAQVSFTGSYSENFNGMGTAGTTAPAGWSFWGAMGGSTSTWTTSIPASGTTSAATAGTNNATLVVSTGASGTSNTNGYNLGASGNTDRALGTSPTSGAGLVLQLRMTNNTGSAVSSLNIGYDIRRFLAVATANDLPGYWLFYSLDSGSTWNNVSALNPVLSGGTVNVPNTVGVTTVSPTTINLASAWAAGAEIRFRWIDDNATQTSPDQIVGLDNLSILIPPTVVLTAPANAATFPLSATIALAADASDSDGSVTNVEFFANGVKLGADDTAPYEFAWSSLALGSHSLTARATDDSGNAGTSIAVNITVVPDLGTGGLYFDGVNDSVTFGAATASLGVSNLTIECWFKRTGTGATTSTGTGGVTAYPLVTKGRGEADDSNVDCNWFLGFNASGQLVADFEDYNNGLNHPITGSSFLTSNVWQHAAVTYSSSGTNGTWVLYLNGVPDATNKFSGTNVDVVTPRYDSTQHAGLATAMTSAGAAAGFFSGKLDEVRVWNYARSASDIQNSYQWQITGATGLLGRWALGETNGVTASNSVAGGVNGTLVNGPAWVAGYPFPSGVSITSPVEGEEFDAPANITVYANAFSSDGTVTNVEFFAGSTSLGSDATEPFTLTWSGVPAGNYALTAVSMDDTGLISTSSVVNISVVTPNFPPTVNLTAPTNTASFALPTNITLTADANDSGGSVTNVEFFASGVKLGSDDTAPYELIWSNLLSGAYALVARATDDTGASTDSAVVNITVTNPNNQPPTVALTSPANGATLVFSNVSLAATAGDTDGVVAKVEFFSGAAKVGEDTNSPFNLVWSGVTNGNYSLTAIATDNDGGSVTSAPVAITVATPITTVLIPRRVTGQPGAVWKYLDNGTDQATAWKETAFDDSAWTNGAAPLGYTDSHIHTTVSYGPNSGNKYITTYFRRTFTVAGASAVQELNLNILRDDGVVVYVNGTEVARQNMPADTVNYLTWAPTTVDGANETTYFASTAAPFPALNEGTNVIAVELHQRDGTSSDLGFDLELISLSLPGDAPTVALTAPTNGATFTAPASINLTADAADSDGTISKVEFFNGATKLGEDTDAPYEFIWNTVPQGNYTLTARATDNVGLTTNSAPVNITVDPPNTLPPTVAITSPTNNSSFIFPANIAITADASDSDGSVAKVEFFSGAAKLGEVTNAPFTLIWTNPPVGAYALTARATDNLTATSTSSIVNVQVLSNLPPAVALVSPANGATNLGAGGSVTLAATVADPESQPLTVTFYGRLKTPPAGPDFTIMTLPDTQFYSENIGGRIQYFTNQTHWIVNSRTNLNTAFVAHMGDMAQNYDTVENELVLASNAMAIVENPLTTLLTYGIPWGGAPGNHDIGSGGTTVYWNKYFGTNRWTGRDYWGGNYGANNDNNYQLFSASGIDFIVINLIYNSSTSGNAAVLSWADSLLKAYPNRRAIITSHWLIGTGNPASWGGHGQAVYDTLKTNANLSLMLCGHIHGEGRRADTFEGRTVHTILQDYQSRANGGDSWLRYFTLSPSNSTITAFTYQTSTGTYENDADSAFVLSNITLNATSSTWASLGTVNLAAGETNAALAWNGLAPSMEYEWYAAVTDGVTPVGSAVRAFTTGDTNAVLPVVAIAATDDAAGEFSADQTLVFSVGRSGATNSPLMVSLLALGSATSGTDYSGFTTNLTIPAGSSNVLLTLTALADNETEGSEMVSVALVPDSAYSLGSPATGLATIADQPAQAFFFANITNANLRSPGDDADDDGDANLVEYFTGSLPEDAGSRLALTVTVSNGGFKVLYSRALNRPDVSGQVVWSASLNQWFTSGQSDGTRTVTFSETVVSTPGSNPELIEASGVVTGTPTDQVFVRLSVQ